MLRNISRILRNKAKGLRTMASAQEQQRGNAFGDSRADDGTVFVQNISQNTMTSTFFASGEATLGATVEPVPPQTFGGVDYDVDPTRDNLDPTDLGARPVTIGEALEHVVENIGDKPVTASDARAIQSAEARATGISTGVKGGPAAQALSVVDSGVNEVDGPKVTVGDVLSDASMMLPQDKVVEQRDASKVQSVEQRNHPANRVEKGGVAATLQAAADYNKRVGEDIDPTTRF